MMVPTVLVFLAATADASVTTSPTPGFFLGVPKDLPTPAYKFSFIMNTTFLLLALLQGTPGYNSKWNPLWYLNAFAVTPETYKKMCKDKEGNYPHHLFSGTSCSLFVSGQVSQVFLWGIPRGMVGFGLFKDQGAVFAVFAAYLFEAIWWLFQAVTGNLLAFELNVKGFTTVFIAGFLVYGMGKRNYGNVMSLVAAYQANYSDPSPDDCSGRSTDGHEYCLAEDKRNNTKDKQICQERIFNAANNTCPPDVAAKWRFEWTLPYAFSLVFSALTFSMVIVNGWLIQLFQVPTGVYREIIQCPKKFTDSFGTFFRGASACQNNLRAMTVLPLFASFYKIMAYFNSGYLSAHVTVLAVVVVELIVFTFNALTTGKYFKSFSKKGNVLQKTQEVLIVAIQVVLPLIQAAIAILFITFGDWSRVRDQLKLD